MQPYYTLSSPQYNRSSAQINASVQLNSVNPLRALEMVAIDVGRTAILDAVRNEATLVISGEGLDLSSPVDLNINLPANLSGRDIYVRVGLKLPAFKNRRIRQSSLCNREK